MYVELQDEKEAISNRKIDLIAFDGLVTSKRHNLGIGSATILSWVSSVVSSHSSWVFYQRVDQQVKMKTLVFVELWDGKEAISNREVDARLVAG